MKANLISGVVAGVIVLAGAGLFVSRGVSAREEGPAKQGLSPRYTVVETEGHNLIVTDNQKETLYFYTIEKDAKIGSDLKLRGTVDLKQVGNEVIKPSNVKLRKE